MWKHKTKWLVRGGRKVRCYLCGKKILAKGDLFLFHGDTGYYSHQSCQIESTTISGNERRRAVKKIAVGAAVVGAIAAGAGKFLDVSSQPKNSPAAQTILTSQGLIPPALTSDPANPVPGQMWYRSDAGVMAHFDAVQNRVVYSSEINDGNVNVTSKGIINGLSVLPNDGKGGFGPDTTKGATAPGQYGSPYTETTGVGEAYTHAANNKYFKIVLSTGTFSISETITITQPVDFEGQGGTQAANASINSVYSPYNVQSISGWPTVVINNISTANTPMFYSDTYISGMKMQNAIFVGNGNSILWFSPPSSAPGSNGNFDFTGSRFINGPTSPGGSVRFVDLSEYGDLQIVNYLQDTTGLGYGALILGGTNCSIRMINVMNYNGAIHLKADTNTFQAFGGNITTVEYEGFSAGTTPTYIFISGVTGLILKPTGPLQNNAPSAYSGNIIAQINIEGSWLNAAGIIDLEYVGGNYIVANEITVRDCIIPSSNSFFNINGGAVTKILATVGKLELINNIGYNTSAWTDLGVTYTLLQTSAGNTGNYLITYKPTPTLSANPPASGTAYQNTNPYDIEIDLPVYATTAGTAGYVTVAKGSSSTPTAIGSQFVNGSTSSTSVDIIRLIVPAGWYYEFTASGVTFGTASVFAD